MDVREICIASGHWCQHPVRWWLYRQEAAEGWIMACTFHANRLLAAGADIEIREYRVRLDGAGKIETEA